MNFIIILLLIQFTNILNAYDNLTTTTESIELNYTNQSTTLLYENFNVNDTTLLITPTSVNENVTKEVINEGKLDVNQEQIEKIYSLSCNITSLTTDYRIWKGNETNEMLIPKKVLIHF